MSAGFWVSGGRGGVASRNGESVGGGGGQWLWVAGVHVRSRGRGDASIQVQAARVLEGAVLERARAYSGSGCLS